MFRLLKTATAPAAITTAAGPTHNGIPESKLVHALCNMSEPRSVKKLIRRRRHRCKDAWAWAGSGQSGSTGFPVEYHFTGPKETEPIATEAVRAHFHIHCIVT